MSQDIASLLKRAADAAPVERPASLEPEIIDLPEDRKEPGPAPRKPGPAPRKWPSVEETHQTMLECAGEYSYAAEQLAISKASLMRILGEHEELNCWLENKAPTWMERNKLTPWRSKRISTHELAISEQRETELFLTHLKESGVPEDKLDKLLAVRNLSKNAFASTFELMHGGLNDMFIHDIDEQRNLRELRSELQKKYTNDENSPEMRAQYFREFILLGKQLREVGDEMIRTTDSTQRGALALAAMREAAQNRSRKKKWKFSAA